MVNLLLAIIYIAFISLGLPDSMLGAAWPNMHQDLNVPISYAGILSVIIALGTIVSSLGSDYITKKLGTGKVTAFSVLITALSLLGFYLSHNFLLLCFIAIPYGLGAGAIDAALNNYVAINYKSKHMSWLHCMWGIGSTLGPYAMGFALINNQPWNNGYLYIFIVQIILSFVLFFTLPLWKKNNINTDSTNKSIKPITIKEIFTTKGIFAVIITFFCYCALEQTTILWASSYLVDNNSINESLAASLGSLFVLGLTIGRFICGFITSKLSDKSLNRLGFLLITIGVLFMLININSMITFISIIFIGFGCAPIYPCIIHSTPEYFGKEKSQSIIGIQMASAYLGVLAMPSLFGIIANHIDIKLLPYYLLILLIIMVLSHEILIQIIKRKVN